MNSEQKRTVEVRLLVVAWVNLTDDTLADTLAASAPAPRAVADIVAAEVRSNLESVAWVEHAIAVSC